MKPWLSLETLELGHPTFGIFGQVAATQLGYKRFNNNTGLHNQADCRAGFRISVTRELCF